MGTSMFSAVGAPSAGPAMPGTAPSAPDGLANITSVGNSGADTETTMPSCGAGALHFFEKGHIILFQFGVGPMQHDLGIPVKKFVPKVASCNPPAAPPANG